MTDINETIDTLQNSLSNCLLNHKIYCYVEIKSHCYPYSQSLIFLFHITDQSDDRRIRELLHILNIDVKVAKTEIIITPIQFHNLVIYKH